MKFRLTARPALTIISSVTACIVWGSTLTRRITKPNSINDNWPRETPPGPKRGGFESYQERVEGNKVRERSPSFGEYYSHPRLFWLSQTPFEQRHIVDGFSLS